MKKSIFLVVLVFIFGTISAQTVLNRFPLEFKTSSDYFQIFNAENQEHDYFAFITNREKTTVLRHNTALFFTDSISVERPNKDFEFMAGVTFAENGNPNLYWSSRDYQKIKMIGFDFSNRTTSNLTYENDFKRDKIIDVFVAANAFNIVSVTPDNKLKFTNFSNTGKNEYEVSLTSYQSAFKNAPKNPFITAILENGIAKIDSKLFSPLYLGVAKVKRYLNPKNVILTFDLEGKTTIFTIDLKQFSVAKKEFADNKIGEQSKSNSFLRQNILYQITSHHETLSISAVDFETRTVLGNFQATSEKEIDFKNSPLLVQAANGRTRILKKTSKFLSKVNYGDVGLTVYATPNYDLFTIGAVSRVVSAGYLAAGFGGAFAGAIGGAILEIDEYASIDKSQSIYFDGFFDENFKHLNIPFRPLYIDELGEYLSTSRIAVQNLYPFQNYVILNYYDSKTNEFVMRKFEDITD
jgi:hypothetical protein